MKAVRLNKIGDFRMEEMPLPEIKGEELLVKVEACGICGSDLPRVFELGAHVHPITIGHEFAGTIVKAAREEDQELVGKTAAVFPLIPCGECEFCKTGHYAQCANYNYLGSRCDGGFAEYCVIPSRWNPRSYKGRTESGGTGHSGTACGEKIRDQSRTDHCCLRGRSHRYHGGPMGRTFRCRESGLV